MKTWLLVIVVSLLVGGTVSSVQAIGCDPHEGTPLSDGCLYTITGGDTPNESDGFPVVNTDEINWWACVQTLNLPDVGYPIAQPFEFNGFQVLALQKVMLQFRPDRADNGGCSQFAYLNTMDLLAGDFGVNLDGVPAHAVLPEDAGASWAQIEANHLALLDQNPVIKAKFLEKPNWIDLYGLPIVYQEQEIDGNRQGAQVLRAQRAVWRIFNIDAPGTTIGAPHLLNVPDMIKQLDGVIIPTSAKTPTGETSSSTPTPTSQQTATQTSLSSCPIVFTSNRDGDSDIYVMDADGGNLQQLTDDPARDWDPAWSPGCTRIVFPSDRDGDNEIYAMDADGGNVQQLTDDPGLDWLPAWSPA